MDGQPMTRALAVCERKLGGDVCTLAAGWIDALLFRPDNTLEKAALVSDQRLLRRLMQVVPASRDKQLIQWQDYNNALSILVKHGDIGLAKELVNRFPDACITQALKTAGRFGQLEFLQWLHRDQAFACWGGHELEKAAKYGHFKTVQWLHRQPLDTPVRLLVHGAAQADGLLLDFALNECQEVPTIADLTAAAESGCLQNLIKMHNRAPSIHLNAYQAALHGHLHIVQWLHEHGGEFDTTTMDAAAEGGHIHILEWLHNFRDDGYTPIVMLHAVAGNRLDAAQWIFDNFDIKWEGDIVDIAANTGSLPMVIWAFEHFPDQCTRRALEAAAAWDNVDMFNWLHPKILLQCPSDVLPRLAKTGDLDLMRDPRIDRHPSPVELMWNAAEKGYINVVSWFYNPEAAQDPLAKRVLDAAATNGHLQLVKWLHERHMPCSTKAMDGAAEFGHHAIVEWLHHNRTEGCTKKAVFDAAWSGDFRMLTFLRSKREECFSDDAVQKAVRGAASRGHLEIAIWLKLNYPAAAVVMTMDNISWDSAGHGWNTSVIQHIINW